MISGSKEMRVMAEAYRAYSIVSDPLMHSSLVQFNSCMHLMSMAQLPPGISLVSCLEKLSEAAASLKAWTIVKDALKRLMMLKMSETLTEDISIRFLNSLNEAESTPQPLVPICARCLTACKLRIGDSCCSSCLHPFFRSMVGYEILPIVEFIPDEAIGPEDVKSLLGRFLAPSEGDAEEDPFLDCIDIAKDNAYKPVRVPREILPRLKLEDVVVLEQMRMYFKCALPEVWMTNCRHCESLFEQTSLDLHMLKNDGRCPVCLQLID
jgi:intraflagellar transport protein 122